MTVAGRPCLIVLEGSQEPPAEPSPSCATLETDAIAGADEGSLMAEAAVRALAQIVAGAEPPIGLVLALGDYSRRVSLDYINSFEVGGYPTMSHRQSTLLEPSLLTEEASIATGVKGPCLTLISPIDAGVSALIWAIDMVQAGEIRAALVGELIPHPGSRLPAALCLPVARPSELQGPLIDWSMRPATGSESKAQGPPAMMRLANALAAPPEGVWHLDACLGSVIVRFEVCGRHER